MKKNKWNVNSSWLLILGLLTVIVVSATAWGFLGFLLSIIILTLALLVAYLFFGLIAPVQNAEKLKSENNGTPASASAKTQKKTQTSEDIENKSGRH